MACCSSTCDRPDMLLQHGWQAQHAAPPLRLMKKSGQVWEKMQQLERDVPHCAVRQAKVHSAVRQANVPSCKL
eukprot:g48180.t1